jgi:hypothetical protein
VKQNKRGGTKMRGKIFFSMQYRVFIFRDAETRVEYPIPPAYRLEGEFELKIRLQSTRSGSAAWWYVGRKARECLNDAPYQPVFRGVISEFEWNPRSVFLYPEEGSEDIVIQGGSQVPNFLAKVIKPVPDPIREFLQKCETSSLYHLRQGNLVIWKVDLINGQVPSNVEIPLGREILRGFYFLNHWISYSPNFVYRVINNKYVGFLEAGDDPRTIVISRDHFNEPLILTPGIWYVTHPIPSAGD